MQEQIDALGVEFAEVSFKQIGKPNCIAIGVAENQLESEQLAYILPRQRAYLIQFILVISALECRCHFLAPWNWCRPAENSAICVLAETHFAI